MKVKIYDLTSSITNFFAKRSKGSVKGLPLKTKPRSCSFNKKKKIRTFSVRTEHLFQQSKKVTTRCTERAIKKNRLSAIDES